MHKPQKHFKIAQFGFGLLIFAGIVIAIADTEWTEVLHSKETPQAITAQELANNGPGNNWHVIVSDYMFENPMLAIERARFQSDKIQSLSCRMKPTGAVSSDKSLKLTVMKRVQSELDARNFFEQKTVLGYAKPSSGVITIIATDKSPSMMSFLLTYGIVIITLVSASFACFILAFLRRRASSA